MSEFQKAAREMIRENDVDAFKHLLRVNSHKIIYDDLFMECIQENRPEMMHCMYSLDPMKAISCGKQARIYESEKHKCIVNGVEQCFTIGYDADCVIAYFLYMERNNLQ